MKTGWLLYDRGDFEKNRMFAAHMHDRAAALGMDTQVVLTHTLKFPLADLPDFVISRQRDHRISAAFEQAGVPVFNSSRVCEICNDKRNTHMFLQGLPLMKTTFIDSDHPLNPSNQQYPLVVKPAQGHGGDRVALVNSELELQTALQSILPHPALLQQPASEAGCDLRVYILFGKIVAAVMRTAQTGIVSNYKRGGHTALHMLTDAQKDLATAVVQRFADHGAPLSFAGVDLLFHDGHPVVNEVEDVVGSRMLYQVSDIDVIDLYIREIAKHLP